MSSTKVCGCCGHPLPDEDLPHMSPSQKNIFVAVRKAGKRGLTTKQLLNVVYDGARYPLTAENSLHVMKRLLNKKLELVGLRIQTHTRGITGGVYRLEKIDVV